MTFSGLPLCALGSLAAQSGVTLAVGMHKVNGADGTAPSYLIAVTERRARQALEIDDDVRFPAATVPIDTTSRRAAEHSTEHRKLAETWNREHSMESS